MGKAATPTKRSGRFATSLASMSLASRELRGSLGVGDLLDGGGIQRRDHDLDAGFIHQPQTLVLKVQKAMPQLGPDMAAEGL